MRKSAFFDAVLILLVSALIIIVPQASSAQKLQGNELIILPSLKTINRLNDRAKSHSSTTLFIASA